MNFNCFKKYDVRGVVGQELTIDHAARIGASLAELLQVKFAVVGGDARESTPELKSALIQGLMSQGVMVFDIGLTGTEEVYFACQHLDCDLGVQITASHNPIEYNGIKFVGKGARPLSHQEFEAVKQRSESSIVYNKIAEGKVEQYNHLPEYLQHLFSYISSVSLRPFRIVVNAGNGVAGHVIDGMESKFAANQIPIEFVKINHEADATFPNGIPNPLLPEGRKDTVDAVLRSKADFGIAWDGDFDRCFFFDELGQFIDGYYIVGLLATSFMQDEPGIGVVHDPRLFWNTETVAALYQGHLTKSMTGHVPIKAKMRACDAVYGGEMSAHHYFKSFGYCDSGMIPWLLILKLLSKNQRTLSQEVKEMQQAFPISGEINFKVDCIDDKISKVKSYYIKDACEVDLFDGLSMSFDTWRFNLRGSATEALLRLNVETRGEQQLLKQKITEITKLVDAQSSSMLEKM